MANVVLIADDLTGACDAGVQFSQKGLHAVVYFDEAPLAEAPPEVMIIDTDSRSLPAEEAYRRVRLSLGSAKYDKNTIFYKKLDSTLRGNLGSEIDACLDVLKADFAVIAPALPSLKRITKNGRHFLDSIPLEQTEVANDPKTPVSDSILINLLAEQSKRKSALFTQETLKTEGNREETVRSLLKEDKTLFVCDAESEEDLQQIVAFFQELPFKILWTGSAGLAAWLPVEGEGLPETFTGTTQGTVLTVAGSRSGVTKQQLDVLAASPEILRITLDPKLLIEKEKRELEVARCCTEIFAGLENGNDLILDVTQNRTLNAKNHTVPLLIVEALAEITASAIETNRITALILTGGDTAKHISKALGVHGITLAGEIEKGLPMSKMVGGPELCMVTKAGAFGEKNSLIHAYQSLKGAVKQ